MREHVAFPARINLFHKLNMFAERIVYSTND